jgi:hypothetical protein
VAAWAAACAVSAAASAWGLLAALDAGGVATPETLLRSVERLRQGVALLAQRERAQAHDVVWVGDSHLIERGEETLRRTLEGALRAERGGEVRVWRVAGLGLDPFGHWCLSDGIARAAPAQVVVELDLAHLSRGWQRERPQLAALVGPGRWLEAARLPLHDVGVSADRLLFYAALRGAGAWPAWNALERAQARAALAYWRAGEALQARSPWPGGMDYRRALERREIARTRVADRRRASAEWARTLYGPALAGAAPAAPALRFLAALLARYRAAGLPVLVYVNPLNVEHLRALGVHDGAGLARTLEAAERVARGGGAAFLDLHDLLPDAAFGDEMDHLDPQAPVQGARRLAERLAQAL